MNASLQILYDEHDVITNAIDVAKKSAALIGKDDQAYENKIRVLINFFRKYADEYHHYKEEEILFPEMAKRNEMLADSVIREMLENHDDFRSMIKNIEKNLDEGKFNDAQRQLEKYTELLLDHIAVENDEVFPMAETIMNDAELENIFFRFRDCDTNLGEEKKMELTGLAYILKEQIL